MRDIARLTREVSGLLILADEVEQRLDEVDERSTQLAVGAGNIAHALERTAMLVEKLDELENRSLVVEAAFAGRARVTPQRAVQLAGPALAWVKGEISASKWAEVLTAWSNGQRQFSAADMGLEAWPEPPAWMGEDQIPW
jgi:hypothetical protein